MNLITRKRQRGHRPVTTVSAADFERRRNAAELRELRDARQKRIDADSFDEAATRGPVWLWCRNHDGMFLIRSVRSGRAALTCGCSRPVARLDTIPMGIRQETDD